VGFRTYLRETGLTGTPILATPIKLAQTSTSYGKVRLVRIRATVGGIFASVAILGIGWQFGSAAASSFQAADTGNGTAHSAASPTSTPSPGAAPTSSPSATGSKSASTASGTYVGAVEQTRFGDVQVQVVVAGGKITDVVALHLTDRGSRSVQISNQAAPILRSEVLATQSAKVNGVSGATYTTDGYLSSVQSAIDKAGL
jgi:uncharacterized protein with FMN-binding domain